MGRKYGDLGDNKRDAILFKMTKDQRYLRAQANELSMKAVQLRDKSRAEWAKANEHLKEMGTAINQLLDLHVELAEVLKRIAK